MPDAGHAGGGQQGIEAAQGTSPGPGWLVTCQGDLPRAVGSVGWQFQDFKVWVRKDDDFEVFVVDVASVI